MSVTEIDRIARADTLSQSLIRICVSYKECYASVDMHFTKPNQYFELTGKAS